MSRLYWWCPECKVEVDPRNVTFGEKHDRCGSTVIAKETSKIDNRPEKLERFFRMLIKEAKRYSLIDLLETWEITYEEYEEIHEYIKETLDVDFDRRVY